MNKKLIMEIANESGLLAILKDHAAEFGNGTLENTPYPELERFTELIVRECYRKQYKSMNEKKERGDDG